MFQMKNATSLMLLVYLLVQVIHCQDLKSNDSSLNEADFPTPEYIQPCSKDDPEFDVCVSNLLNHLKPYLVKGISELGLPSIDPMTIPEISVKNNGNDIKVDARFSNVEAIGATSYEVTKVLADLTSLRFDVYLTIPKLELGGHYEAEGDLLKFPLKSHGVFWSEFDDVTAVLQAQGEVEIRKGVRNLKIAKLEVDFNVGSVTIQANDAMHSNDKVGKILNKFLNDNAHEIIERVKPTASGSIAQHFLPVINNAVTKIPLKVWLLNA